MGLGELGRRAALTAAGMVLVGALAGCAGGDGVGPTPTDTTGAPTGTSGATEAPTGSPTGSPTVEVPAVPKPVPSDAMRRDDVAGAEAAGIYFTELYRYVYATGDLSDWKMMSHPECIFCNSVTNSVGDLVAAGEHVEGGEVQIIEVSSSDPAPGYEFYQVNVRILHEPTVVVGKGGIRPRSEAGDVLIKLAVGRTADGWLVREGEAADYAGG